MGCGGSKVDHEAEEEEKKKTEMMKKRSRRCSVSAECFTADDMDGAASENVNTVKNEEETSEIKSIMSKIILFQSLEVDQKDELVLAFQKKGFAADEVIINQGEEGDYFYLISSGTTNAAVNGNHVDSKTSGGFFGELALMYNAPRAATVTADAGGPVETWALDRSTFQRVVVAGGRRTSVRIDDFLSAVDIFKSMTKGERAAVSDNMQRATFNAGDTIIVEGDKCTDESLFYVVESGTAQATTASGASEPMSYDVGKYFGELALLNKEPRAATVTATSDSVVCRTLPRDAFERLLGPVKDIMERNAEEKYH